MNSKIALAMASLFLIMGACTQDYIPKPKGYFRIDLPEATYHLEDTLNVPFSIEISDLSYINYNVGVASEPGWFNIVYPKLKARIFTSYHEINPDSLNFMMEDLRKMANKHIPKADNIVEETLYDTVLNKYGVTYDFIGGTASNYQFVITDSVSRIWRGALYFDCHPNPDSLQPSETYLKKDLSKIIESFRWTE